IPDVHDLSDDAVGLRSRFFRLLPPDVLPCEVLQEISIQGHRRKLLCKRYVRGAKAAASRSKTRRRSLLFYLQTLAQAAHYQRHRGARKCELRSPGKRDRDGLPAFAWREMKLKCERKIEIASERSVDPTQAYAGMRVVCLGRKTIADLLRMNVDHPVPPDRKICDSP